MRTKKQARDNFMKLRDKLEELEGLALNTYNFENDADAWIALKCSAVLQSTKEYFNKWHRYYKLEDKEE